MRLQFAIERVDQARTRVRRAIECWNGADLSQVAAVQKLLEESVLDLEQVSDRLSASIGTDDALYSRVLDLKNDIVRLLRMIDTCSAFYRGLAVRLGEGAPTYTASGQIEAGPDPETRGLQG